MVPVAFRRRDVVCWPEAVVPRALSIVGSWEQSGPGAGTETRCLSFRQNEITVHVQYGYEPRICRNGRRATIWRHCRRSGSWLGYITNTSGYDFRKAQGLTLSQRRPYAAIYDYSICAARPASHHHSVGNAARPYFGTGSGWLNRSHRAVRTLLTFHCGTT
jgi:hypothetical protein